MNFNLSLFLAALGIACVLEALPWLVSPQRMREALDRLAELTDDQLRIGGVIMLILGLLICALGRFLRGE